MNPLIDSVKVISDTLTSAVTQTEALHKIGFDPNNIIENDGLLISVVGYVVVFLALLMLYIFFSNLTRFLIYRQRKRLKGAGKESDLQKEWAVRGIEILLKKPGISARSGKNILPI